MSSVTLIGPVSKDIIVKDNSSYKSIGGPVFYQSSVFSKLEINTNVLTTISKDDKELLKGFPSNVNLIPYYINETIKFQNIYPDDDPNHRIQKASIPKNPIDIKNILSQIKYSDAVLLGPLCPYDIPLKTIEDLSKLKTPIYLGVQGYLRHLDRNKIILKPWERFTDFLKFIDVLFMDENESAIILGEKHSLEKTAKIIASFGPQEVVITCGSRGSLIYSKKLDEIYKIPAFRPECIEDPTGLGDTYMAAYAARKLEIEDPKKCGMFAAAASSLKLENKCSFKGSRKQIEDRSKK
jgi:sugar/nucleoside kinase (ribokinase family)